MVFRNLLIFVAYLLVFQYKWCGLNNHFNTSKFRFRNIATVICHLICLKILLLFVVFVGVVQVHIWIYFDLIHFYPYSPIPPGSCNHSLCLFIKTNFTCSVLPVGPWTVCNHMGIQSLSYRWRKLIHLLAAILQIFPN